MAAAAGGGGLEGLPASAAARFDEFQFQKCIGEGSYGRVSSVSTANNQCTDSLQSVYKQGSRRMGLWPAHPDIPPPPPPQVYLAMWRETQVAVKILLGGDGGADASGAQGGAGVLAVYGCLLACAWQNTAPPPHNHLRRLGARAGSG
jgi:hypothetical protein